METSESSPFSFITVWKMTFNLTSEPVNMCKKSCIPQDRLITDSSGSESKDKTILHKHASKIEATWLVCWQLHDWFGGLCLHHKQKSRGMFFLVLIVEYNHSFKGKISLDIWWVRGCNILPFVLRQLFCTSALLATFFQIPFNLPSMTVSFCFIT